jgi:uncharacterized protein YndB with AHSA1/START domain
VWHAIATAEGISGWMMPTELEPREGGRVRFEMGPEMESVGKVTVYEPQRRIAYEEDWASLSGHAGADVTPLVSEFLVEARSGGTCVVHVVTSAYGTGAEWENEFFAEMTRGWAAMLDNLRLYVAHFSGETATSLHAGATVGGSPEEAIDGFRARLGIGPVGSPATLLGATGVVERSIPSHFLVRLEQPVRGLLSFYAYQAESTGVFVAGFLFGADAPAQAEQLQKEWQAWLDDVAAETTGPARS